MIRIARERIADLFGLADAEWRRGNPRLSDRYVTLARRVGTRYNLRIPPEYRELYCRNCSTYWAEGRTVRTRMRDGIRVRTCLLCGAVHRTPTGTRRAGPRTPDFAEMPKRRASEAVPVDEPEPLDGDPEELGFEDEE